MCVLKTLGASKCAYHDDSDRGEGQAYVHNRDSDASGQDGADLRFEPEDEEPCTTRGSVALTGSITGGREPTDQTKNCPRYHKGQTHLSLEDTSVFERHALRRPVAERPGEE